MNLLTFLRARLDEDEAAAQRDLDSTLPSRYVDADRDAEPLLSRFDADRVLREVQAKRTIIAQHLSGEAGCDWYPYDRYCVTMELMTGVYSDHPDYDPAWGHA